MIHDSRFKFRDRRGFTLVEFLVVIGIVIILSTIGLINLYGKNKRERFDNSVIKLTTIMTEAVDNSISLKSITSGGSTSYWYVQLVPDGCQEPEGAILKLSTITGAYNKHVLPIGINFENSLTFSPAEVQGCKKDIKFTKITGAPTNPASATLKIYLESDPTISSTISVSASGKVSYTLDGGVVGN